MPPQRCRAPGCGRFITANTEFCRGHSEESAPVEGILQDEIRALRLVLTRLLNEENLDMQARHIPRITSASIQAARARHQLGERDRDELMALIGAASTDLDQKITR